MLHSCASGAVGTQQFLPRMPLSLQQLLNVWAARYWLWPRRGPLWPEYVLHQGWIYSLITAALYPISSWDSFWGQLPFPFQHCTRCFFLPTRDESFLWVSSKSTVLSISKHHNVGIHCLQATSPVLMIQLRRARALLHEKCKSFQWLSAEKSVLDWAEYTIRLT